MKYILFIVLLCGIQVTYAQDYAIPFHEVEITMDGQLNEDVWQDLPIHTNFHNYLPSDEGLSDEQTEVKIFHDGSFVYVGSTFYDTMPSQVGSLKRDDIGSSIASSDGVVVILDTQNQEQNAFYFAVNAKNTQVDALVERQGERYDINRNWSTVWESQVSTIGNTVFYEVKIPLRALSFNPNNDIWGVQFYTRNIKKPNWSIFTDLAQNFRLFDLRFTQKFKIYNLGQTKQERLTVTPSLTTSLQKDVVTQTQDETVTPSLDVQYNVNSSLKLDVTINPDFSQVDVDEQVTNLSRFAINFPEQRKFFIENSDLFAYLGPGDVNPFNSRRIGAEEEILGGLKLSGNIAEQTKIGVLSVQSKKGEDELSTNYTTLVGQQGVNDNFTTTAYLVNRQETDGLSFTDDYNRVAGANLNYTSNDNKWTGAANYGKSFSHGVSGDNNLGLASMSYNTRTAQVEVSARTVGKNYITDVGFNPRIYNFDAITEEISRVGYREIEADVQLFNYLDDHPTIRRHRYAFVSSEQQWDETGDKTYANYFYNSALFFHDTRAAYINVLHQRENLKYAFDPIGSGDPILPDQYNTTQFRAGYFSKISGKLSYQGWASYGGFYNGNRFSSGVEGTLRMLPIAKLGFGYFLNKVDLKENGERTFHLANVQKEIYFNNRLNWTTYLQYNTQADNVNVNTRFQWEYKPLSYVYLVLTDNLTEQFNQKNWGIALKANYRLDM